MTAAMMKTGRTFIGNVDSYDNETVAGWIADPLDPGRVFEVELFLDGVLRARVQAGFPRAEIKEHGYGSGRNAFYFTLPPARRDESVKVEVREAASQQVLDGSMVLARTASPTYAGLTSSDAAALLYKPLLGLGADAFSFHSNHLMVKGVYLPPGGDPFAYEVTGDEGVVFELHRPVHGHEPEGYFWFWPNAAWSMWRIDIDLARTRHRGPAYRFVFRPRHDSRADCTEIVCVPKDLGLWQQLPSDARMNRVQLGDFPEASPLRAAMHCDAIAALARRHRDDLRDSNVLDWGCGWGRLTRAFAASERFAELWGADIDEDNLAWAGANIPAATFVQVPLYPPTSLPANHFDLVYAVSVMTHLTHDAQEKWLAEIWRILRPGGCAILTFHGRTALGFSSRYVGTQTVANFREKGFDDAMECGHLDDIIGAGYYKNTFQTPDDVRTRWGRHLRVAEIVEAGVGLQDVALLVKD